MKYNEIQDTDRAKIAAILCRVVSELAGSNPALDRDVAAAVRVIMQLCCQSPNAKAWDRALRLLEQDWVFVVRKIGKDSSSKPFSGTK
jgi:hypothetical protein